jgi:hypothetical protein
MSSRAWLPVEDWVWARKPLTRIMSSFPVSARAGYHAAPGGNNRSGFGEGPQAKLEDLAGIRRDGRLSASA